MKSSTIVLIGVGTLIVAWQLWYTFLIGIQKPKYKVLEKKNGYEIRKYEPYISANVTVPAPYKSAVKKGLNTLSDYIFGKNKTYETMPMTSPVFIQEESNLKEYDIAFVMPLDRTMETLPQPLDKTISIKQEKPKLVAAYKFTWYPSDKRLVQRKKEFIKLLKQDNIQMRSPIRLARYNPPFIIPFFMRNELIVEISKEPQTLKPN